MQGFESDAEKTAAEKGNGQKKNDESNAAKTQCVRNVAGANRGKMYAGGNTRRQKDAPHCLSKMRRKAKEAFCTLNFFTYGAFLGYNNGNKKIF